MWVFASYCIMPYANSDCWNDHKGTILYLFLSLKVPGLRHVISQAATGYGIDPATGHMQPHGQSQVYHDSHHLHHQVRKVYTVIKVFLVSNLRFI